jgi:hypothetical protein
MVIFIVYLTATGFRINGKLNSESAFRGCHNVSRGPENFLEAVVFIGHKSLFVESVRVLVEAVRGAVKAINMLS